MDEAEMIDRARELVARFAKHLHEEEAEPIFRGASSGDRTAIPALAEILVRDEVAVTPEARRELLEYLDAIGVVVEGVDSLPEAETGERMDALDLAQLAHAVVARLTPKLEPLQANRIRELDGAGAWEVALPELVGILVDQRIAVTGTDRDDLYRLLELLGEPTVDVSRLIVERTED